MRWVLKRFDSVSDKKVVESPMNPGFCPKFYPLQRPLNSVLTTFFETGGLLLCLLLAVLSGQSQPSGGPYGPTVQNYEVPKGASHVYYVAPDGKPEVAGTALAEPTTLESAIAKVTTGDAIILRGGTYRTGN